ncbi:LCCL domain-containing protein [Archangium gephyra]|uniref:LCCL domain-containing protein n=1 Tax=Archangium gephyra TaxID=48 RepID=UPI003B81A1D1
MFKNTGGISGFRLLAVVGALVVGGCGGSELDAAGLPGEESTGVAQQAMEACGYCPSSMSNYTNQIGTTLTCRCTAPQASATNTSLLGTDAYTSDSSVCRAAVHAGAITTNGGYVTVTMLPNQITYTGSTRNGVTSSSYYSTTWPASFSVATGSQCAFPCHEHLARSEYVVGDVVSCNCSSEYISTASHKTIWGTNIYTHDSALCQAAVHAGVITTSGGVIHAVLAPGQSSYVSSTQNGITSSSYGPYGRSFYFQ